MNGEPISGEELATLWLDGDEPEASECAGDEWPAPEPLGDELPPVEALNLACLPVPLRGIVEDLSERMQTAPDLAAAAGVVTLAGSINRRVSIQPKRLDSGWTVTPNLWGLMVAPPGYLKSPILNEITRPLVDTQTRFALEDERALKRYEDERELGELAKQAWRESTKALLKRGSSELPPAPPDDLEPPVPRRLIVTSATMEKLHELLAQNPQGLLCIRDEMVGLLAELEREGRQHERAFWLTAWSGDQPFFVDRIGRGSIRVDNVCLSLLGGTQPGRLRAFLEDTLSGGAGDDGTVQRMQIAVWPDAPGQWLLVDRPPNAAAAACWRDVISRLATLQPETPIHMRFDEGAQELFYVWLAELEGRVRNPNSGLHPALVSHFAKFRSLQPSLAGSFELAGRISENRLEEEMLISLDSARRAAAYCDYLESHARRIYSCASTRDASAARELSRHLQGRDLGAAFTTRDVYLKGWRGVDNPETARAALNLLEDAGWVRRQESKARSGRPSEHWKVNPRIGGAK